MRIERANSVMYFSQATELSFELGKLHNELNPRPLCHWESNSRNIPNV
jgi:hypothetical protein